MKPLQAGDARRLAAKFSALMLVVMAAHTVHANPALDGTIACNESSTNQTALPWILPGRHDHQVLIALQSLQNVASHGLNPRQYDAEGLIAWGQRLLARERLEPVAWFADDGEYNAFNRRLTDAMVCYMGHLRDGVLDRAFAHPRRQRPEARWDVRAALRQGWHEAGFGEVIRRAAPTTPQYQHLRGALKRARQLVAANISIITGDDAAQPEHLMEMPSRADDDGLIARLELALERHRWTMRDHRKHIVVNLPAQTLAYHVDDAIKLRSRIVIGTRRGAKTPLLEGAIKRMEINPVWYVPRSIAKRHLLAKMQEDSNYLRDMGMQVVWKNRRRTNEVNAHTIKAIKRNRVRIEQLPGEKNALGAVKFVLPNRQAIFMHGTDKPELFAESRRDRSSGCVRIEQADSLAQLVLANHRRYSPAWYERARARKKPSWIEPRDEVMVSFVYASVSADAEGRITVHDDVYRWDKRALTLMPRWQAALHSPKTVSGNDL